MQMNALQASIARDFVSECVSVRVVFHIVKDLV